MQYHEFVESGKTIEEKIEEAILKGLDVRAIKAPRRVHVTRTEESGGLSILVTTAASPYPILMPVSKKVFQQCSLANSKTTCIECGKPVPPGRPGRACLECRKAKQDGIEVQQSVEGIDGGESEARDLQGNGPERGNVAEAIVCQSNDARSETGH